MRIVNIHRKDTDNIGDIYSSPLNYYNFDQPELRIDIWNDIEKYNFEADNVIVGGGGLLSHEEFLPSIEKLIRLKKDKKIKRLIFWGVGKNAHFDRNICKDLEKTYLDNLSCADIIGIRDISTRFDYTPCPSCNLIKAGNFFNEKPQNKLVYYEHDNYKLPKIFPGKKLRNTETDIKKILRFLGSARVVVTNTYHGVYWSLLLGKKVYCLPFSSKFDNFKSLDNYNLLSDTTIPENLFEDYLPSKKFLNECLNLNDKFFLKVKKLIS